jgi:hypothetical protein
MKRTKIYFYQLALRPIAVDHIKVDGTLPPQLVAQRGRPKKVRIRIGVNWKPKIHQLSAQDVVHMAIT